MKIRVIPVEGETREIELGPTKGERSSAIAFKEIQKHVGGYIILWPGTNLVVDEDGLPKGLPVNPRASEAAGAQVVGNAVEILDDKDRRKLFGR